MSHNKKYSIIDKFKHSIIIDDFYFYVIHEPLIKSILYMILLSLVLSIPYFATSSITSLKVSNELINQISSSEFPEYVIEDGVLTTNPEDVYSFSIADRLIVIDSKNNYNLNDLINEGDGFLFNSSSMIVINKGFIPMTFDYADYQFQLTYLKDKSLLLEFLHLSNVTIPVGLLIYSIIKTNFMSLITVFAAFLFLNTRKHMYKIELNAKQTFITAIYSTTLALTVYNLLISLPISNIVSANRISLFAIAILFLTLSYYTHHIIRLLLDNKTNLKI